VFFVVLFELRNLRILYAFFKIGWFICDNRANLPNGHRDYAQCHLTRRPCVRADRRYVVWLSPQDNQSSTPGGIGISFVDDKLQLQSCIEKLLGSMLNSGEPTFTM
jgi:Tfp pilus assembly protein PilZ